MSETPRLVLASTSIYRRRLLEQLGLEFEAASPAYEEEHDLPLPPEELVLELAARKAKSLVPSFPGALIIGADQVAEADGRVLLKPGTAERAQAQLANLAGRTHRLFTGLVLLEASTGRLERRLDVHHMTMRALDAAEIAAYVEREQPIDCAGAYKIEGRGIALFAAMTGDDYTGIIGLPLTKLVDLLRRFGWPVPFGSATHS
jgi:septum formation protein